MSKEFLVDFLPTVSNSLIHAWSGKIDSKIIHKLQKLTENGDLIGEKGFKDHIENVEDFNVIVHGDLWCTNILFSYNELGKVQDAKIVSN